MNYSKSRSSLKRNVDEKDYPKWYLDAYAKWKIFNIAQDLDFQYFEEQNPLGYASEFRKTHKQLKKSVDQIDFFEIFKGNKHRTLRLICDEANRLRETWLKLQTKLIDETYEVQRLLLLGIPDNNAQTYSEMRQKFIPKEQKKFDEFRESI